MWKLFGASALLMVVLTGCMTVGVNAPAGANVVLASDSVINGTAPAVEVREKTHVWIGSGLIPVTNNTTADLISADCRRVALKTEMTFGNGLVTGVLAVANSLIWGLMSVNGSLDPQTASLMASATTLLLIPQIRTTTAHCLDKGRRFSAIPTGPSRRQPVRDPISRQRLKKEANEALPAAVARSLAKPTVSKLAVETGCPESKISIKNARRGRSAVTAVLNACGEEYQCNLDSTDCQRDDSPRLSSVDLITRHLSVETGCPAEQISATQRADTKKQALFRMKACSRYFVCSASTNRISCKPALVGGSGAESDDSVDGSDARKQEIDSEFQEDVEPEEDKVRLPIKSE